MLELDPAIPDPQEMPGRQRLDPLEERPRRARAEEGEEVVDPFGIGPGGDQARSQQRLDLRAPEQPAIDLGVIERADPDPVAAEDQGPVVPVPERDGELAPGLLEHALAEIFVEVDPGLGVAPRGQAVAAASSSWRSSGYSKSSPLKATQIEPSSLVSGCRPPARSTIDSRRAPERHARLDVELLVVRPAMSDRPGHRQEAWTGELARPVRSNAPGDPAHDDPHDQCNSIGTRGLIQPRRERLSSS